FGHTTLPFNLAGQPQSSAVVTRIHACPGQEVGVMKTIIISCAFGITAAVRDCRFFVLLAVLAAPAVVLAAEQSKFDDLLQAVTEELQPQTDADAQKQQAQSAQAMTH